MKTRQDREWELRRMPREALEHLYFRLYDLPPGGPHPVHVPLIQLILDKEFPQAGSGDKAP